MNKLNNSLDSDYRKAHIVPDDNESLIEFLQKQKACGNKGVIMPTPAIRKRLATTYRALIQKISDLWNLAAADRILEVGCGKLNSEGQSFLSEQLPPSISSKFTLTDLNHSVNESKKNNFIPSNLMALTQTFETNSFDVVLASCTLDTVGTKNLTPALKKIREVLKPGGKLISFSDLPPYFNTICSHYSQKGMIIFPYMNSHGIVKGIQVLPQDQYDHAAQNEAFSSDEKKFLHWFGKLSFRRREEMVPPIGMGSDEDNKCAISLSKLAERLPGIRVIDNDKFYHKHLQKGLKEAGFTIKVFGEIKTSCIVQGSSRLNYQFLRNGDVCEEKIHVLSPGYIYQHLSGHFVVAEK